MGFKRQRKTYRLVFEDYPGLEIMANSPSIGVFMNLAAAADVDKSAESTQDLFKGFARNLVSWNLEDDNGPVPATYEGVLSQDFDFMLEVIRAWMDAIAGVAPPLPESLNGGGISPEESLQLERLSASLRS